MEKKQTQTAGLDLSAYGLTAFSVPLVYLQYMNGYSFQVLTFTEDLQSKACLCDVYCAAYKIRNADDDTIFLREREREREREKERNNTSEKKPVAKFPSGKANLVETRTA
jgi:hypothetical protein